MFALFEEDFLKFFARKLLIFRDPPGRESRKIPKKFKIVEIDLKY